MEGSVPRASPLLSLERTQPRPLGGRHLTIAGLPGDDLFLDWLSWPIVAASGRPIILSVILGL